MINKTSFHGLVSGLVSFPASYCYPLLFLFSLSRIVLSLSSLFLSDYKILSFKFFSICKKTYSHVGSSLIRLNEYFINIQLL